MANQMHKCKTLKICSKPLVNNIPMPSLCGNVLYFKAWKDTPNQPYGVIQVLIDDLGSNYYNVGILWIWLCNPFGSLGSIYGNW